MTSRMVGVSGVLRPKKEGANPPALNGQSTRCPCLWRVSGVQLTYFEPYESCGWGLHALGGAPAVFTCRQCGGCLPGGLLYTCWVHSRGFSITRTSRSNTVCWKRSRWPVLAWADTSAHDVPIQHRGLLLSVCARVCAHAYACARPRVCAYMTSTHTQAQVGVRRDACVGAAALCAPARMCPCADGWQCHLPAQA